MAKKEMTVEEKLRILYDMQLIDSKIDNIRAVQGELPLEVEDFENDIIGLNTRIEKIKSELDEIENKIKEKELSLKESDTLIVRYGEQQDNVRNNREYDSLTKEIEYQNLEKELSNKIIRGLQSSKEDKNTVLNETNEKISKVQDKLDTKRKELKGIMSETEKEEDALSKKSDTIKSKLDDRLLNAYSRIRKKVKNGLAVVSIDRGASSGSFFTIPPQHQLDIASRKKIITDEHSGRILVDAELANEEKEKMEKFFKKL